MGRAAVCLLGGALLAFTAVTAVGAQDQGTGRKPPQQTTDRGIDDAGSLPPGQEKKLGERNIEAVTVTQLPNGVILAQLDESFEDAIVVTRDADGTLRYTCIHGLPAAGKHVNTLHAPVLVAPILEEK